MYQMRLTVVKICHIVEIRLLNMILLTKKSYYFTLFLEISKNRAIFRIFGHLQSLFQFLGKIAYLPPPQGGASGRNIFIV